MGVAEREAFRDAVQDVTPLTPHGRFLDKQKPPPPIPLSHMRDPRELIYESLHDPAQRSLEAEEEGAFLREGLRHQILGRLRRGEWSAQAELDLHGLTRLESKLELADFLYECKRRGVRCVRIIHGKGLGSPNQEPVLKWHVRHWLMQRPEIQAFVDAPRADGGSGAVVVLLRGRG